MEIKTFTSIKEAKMFQPRETSLIFISNVEGIDAFSHNWKECRASSIPEEIKTDPSYQEGIVIQVKENKIKFFYLGKKKSLTTALQYRTAIETFLKHKEV